MADPAVELMVGARPSSGFGLRQATRLWKLVVAVWLMSSAVYLPAAAVAWAAAAASLASLPVGGLPEGDALLIVVECLRPVLAPLGIAVVTGWAALWAWTVLWHAGVVRWLLYAGRAEVRLAEVLGHGLMGWWRWARLAVVSSSVLLAAQLGLWSAWWTAGEHAPDNADHTLLGYGLIVALFAAVLVAVLCWLAILRGSWLLGAGDRRSALLAWAAGCRGSLRQPVRSLVTLVTWAAPGLVALLLPLFVGWRFEGLRGGLPWALVEVAAGLLGAFCWVGLFMSFAPVTGLVGDSATKQDAE